MRTQKALYNIATSLIYQIVSIICGLIAPKLILASFGSTYNGVINSATQFLSIITILNLGIAGATRVALYNTLAVKDTIGTSRIMKATKNYMRKVAFCLLIYSVILCVIYPIISHNNLTRSDNMILIAIVSISSFAEYFFGISNQTLLTADQASYVMNLINIIKTIINTILIAVLIKLGASIYIVKLGSAIIFFLAPVILEIYTKKKYKLTNKCTPDDSAIKNRGAVAFHSIANIIHNNTDLVVLTLFTDAKLISVYTVYYLVVGKIKSLMTVFTTGLESAFGNMWVKKEIDAINRNFRMFEYGIFTFTAIMFSCVGILILPFIELYTKEVTDVNYIRVGFATLVTVTEAAHCLRQPYLTLVQATGFYEETKIGAMIEALLNIGISLILVIPLGINGVMFGTLVANIFRTTQYSIFISNNILHRSYSQIVRRLLWLLGVCCIAVLSSLKIYDFIIFPTGWIGWIIKAVITFAISCIVALIMSLIFYKSDFLYFKNVFIRALGKRVKH